MDFKIISMFNHKGGVSKTTTSFNIGWKLAESGHKVLLVDGDPQCNLTGVFLGDDFDSYYENELTNKNNIKDGVKSAFKSLPKPIEAIDCVKNNKNENLFLLPGHMDLSEYESSLSLAINSNNAIATLQNLPGAFYELITKCVEKYDFEYILIDMNPGLSAVNQVLFTSSNAFIIPTNPDPFSLMALMTMKKILPRWSSWASTAQVAFSEASYPLPETTPQFLGHIIQRYNIRNKKPAKSYQNKIDEINNYIDNDIVPEMISSGMLNEDNTIEEYCLGYISDFGALIQRSADVGTPVFALEDEELGQQGSINENMINKRGEFNTTFTEISDKVIRRLEEIN